MVKNDLKYTFTFGKYKGRNIKDVFDSEGVDVPYLKWCLENVSYFNDVMSKSFKKSIINHNPTPSSFGVGDMMSSTTSYFNAVNNDPTIF